MKYMDNISAKYVERILMMDPSDMQDEVNHLVIDGMPISMIDGQIGIRCKHVRIYDYNNNRIIMRFKKS